MIETDTLLLDVATIGLTAGITSVITFFVGVKKATKKMSRQLDNLTKDNELIKRCLIITAKLNDMQTKKAHPEVTTELEQITKEMLEKLK